MSCIIFKMDLERAFVREKLMHFFDDTQASHDWVSERK